MECIGWKFEASPLRTEENEIGDSDLKTYGVINRDPATATSGDCFSQDITDAVELGEEYQYSFWAKLSDDIQRRTGRTAKC